MIIDLKQRPDSSKEKGKLPQTMPVSATSSSPAERKLAIELPTPRLIYTSGSVVSGIVRLGSKDRVSIEEVQVSLVCAVRSIYHRNHRGSIHDFRRDDFRRETTKLFHRDQIVWRRASGDAGSPPADLPFSIVIPELGNDTGGNNPNAPLPPSFRVGKRTGWSMVVTNYGILSGPVGFVKYYVKASVERKGPFKFKDRAFQPFVFLPPSPAPPLLPPLPEFISYDEPLRTLSDLWKCYASSKNIRNGIFSSLPPAQASTELWLPDVPSFPRLTRIPFCLCFVVRSGHGSKATVANSSPPKDIPGCKLDKASLHLRMDVRSCAKHGVQHHTRTFDKEATDNFLHGLTIQESDWVMKDSLVSDEAFWEKGYMWLGFWTFKETPNFVNRQLEVKYALIAEIPIKGLGNDVKLTSKELNIITGITLGDNATSLPGNEVLGEDFPPNYGDDMSGEEDEGDNVGEK